MHPADLKEIEPCVPETLQPERLRAMAIENVERWVGQLSSVAIPVLPQSIERLRELKARADSIRARDISQAVLHDPMLTLSVLRFLRTRRTNRMHADITTVEHAIMMLGVNPFFASFSALKSIERVLGDDKVAIRGLMTVVARARHAAMHARTWAALRNDIESDEVIIAALLHDMAEMMLWCFVPRLAEQIEARLQEDRSLRSADVQFDVLGFRLNDLEMALVKQWDLPGMLASLLDDYHANRPRARNVLLAVNLARHAAHGWEDPALPDDLHGVHNLIGGTFKDIRQRVYETALDVVRDHGWYGHSVPPVWLPPYPLQVEEEGDTHTGPASSSRVFAHVHRILSSDFDDGFWGSGKLLRSGPEGNIRFHPLLALAVHGLYKGLGLSRIAYYAVDPDGLARVQYLGGSPASSVLVDSSLPVSEAVLAMFREHGDADSVWWRGHGDVISVQSLPRQWQSIATNSGFFLSRISSPEGEGLLFADAALPLTDDQYARFRMLCTKLATRLNEKNTAG